MRNPLARILNNHAPRPWLTAHPNAHQVKKVPTNDGYVVSFVDDRSGEMAIYETDSIGNVKHLDVIAQ